MQRIAVVDAGRASEAFYREYFARIGCEMGADGLIVITDGDIDRAGSMAATDKYERTQMFLRAGASAVVEMPLCSLLLADNVYAFAVTAMLQKLGCVGRIAIPYVGGSEALFDRIAGFLFDEPAPYQKRMRELRTQGVELRSVLPEVLDGFIPGAGIFMSEPINRMAVEQYITLRRAYFPAKPQMIRLEKAPELCAPAPAQDRRLLEALKQKLLPMAPEKAPRWMESMYYGNERVDGRVLNLLHQPEVGGFRELSVWAERPGEPAVAIRWHLLGCLTEYRKVDSFVCIIYNYIPYIRVLGMADEPVLEQLKASVGTTLLVDTLEQKDFSQLTDEAKGLLAEIDGRGRELFLASR